MYIYKKNAMKTSQVFGTVPCVKASWELEFPPNTAFPFF